MKETLAFQVLILYRDFLAYTTGKLKEIGLSFGLMPLVLYTGKHPGCLQKELREALHLDWGYSQRSIEKLVETGFMTKEHEGNPSGNSLHLTERGEKAFQLCHTVFDDWDKLRTKDFTDEEKETLSSLLKKAGNTGLKI